MSMVHDSSVAGMLIAGGPDEYHDADERCAYDTHLAPARAQSPANARTPALSAGFGESVIRYSVVTGHDGYSPVTAEPMRSRR